MHSCHRTMVVGNNQPSHPHADRERARLPGFGILTDPAAAKSRLPAGSYGWGGIYGTQFWIDPANRVVGLVMTQTAIIGSGAISNPIREAFYTAD
jgi:CubicO group peptidase (beta-lactamase class C family)